MGYFSSLMKEIHSDAGAPAAMPTPVSEAEAPAEPVGTEPTPAPGPSQPPQEPAVLDLSDGNKVPQDDDAKRKAHIEAEAKRKAEFEARQADKKQAEADALRRLDAMSDSEVTAAAKKRVEKDTEMLTRRNMKDCVANFIAAHCETHPAFARLTMHPGKSMVNCFRFINRKAREFAEQEMKDTDQKPESGVYGLDVPDDLCYRWAVAYFEDPDAPEDHKDEEKFIPRPYSGPSGGKAKKTATPKKEQTEPENEPTQLTLL